MAGGRGDSTHHRRRHGSGVLLGIESPDTLRGPYPALAYAAALADGLPTGRITNAKTNRMWRNEVCERLARAEWVDGNGIDLGDLNGPRANEDDFDAHLTAAAVLRCIRK